MSLQPIKSDGTSVMNSSIPALSGKGTSLEQPARHSMFRSLHQFTSKVPRMFTLLSIAYLDDSVPEIKCFSILISASRLFSL